MNKTVTIGNRQIGEGKPAFIIAELGSNHDGKLNQAKELIDTAVQGGVDAVKFQFYRTESLYPKSHPLFAMFKENEVSKEWVAILSEYAGKKGVVFLASPFDAKAIDFLDEIGVAAYKWASPEIFDLSLLKYAASKKRPMIVSTGMCNLADVQGAVTAVQSAGNENIVLLHCISLYPAEFRHVNLRMMDTLKSAFRVPVGFSDHTLGITMPIAAAARGACVIEKHFTLSRKLKGPDHFYALEPDELKVMVKSIREVEQCLGSPIKAIINGVENPALHNKGIVAREAIQKGTELTDKMLAIKRSPEGIQAKFRDIVIGRKAKKNIEADEPITWNEI